MNFDGARLVEASPERTWDAIAEPAKFLSLIPVVKEVTTRPSGEISAYCVFPLGLGNLHLTATVKAVDGVWGESTRLVGTALGDGVHVSFDNKILLAPASRPNSTTLRWDASVVIRGPIVGMAQHVAPLLVSGQIDSAIAAFATHLASV
jgi:carbon monoxide dehydrogenase subunit G